ncbi:MAG: hypothetical protein J3K34DRAFT_367859 [Monoraphidium minutum]|nr:MAG: hypothetical protein J3K34DRAFT_367859 [Monoraphidium minutum]
MGSKLSQQLKDVLSICGGGLPGWCRQLVVSSRFLFPFEARRRYFYSTAFGLARALQHMQQQQSAEGLGGALERDSRELRIGRLQRQKVRVSRRRILDSAIKVMELYARNKAVLELEYFGEVGTGLGPTLEFFTLLSHELRRKALGMWRHEAPGPPGGGGGDGGGAEAVTHDSAPPPGAPGGAADAFVYAPWGLFPAPLPEGARGGPAGQRLAELFRLLGRTVAKALQDGRLLDLPLSHLFFRAAMGRPLDLYDVTAIDPGLGQSLQRLAGALAAWRAGGGDGPLLVDGCALEDLCLTFTLPGYPDYQLRPGGADLTVDAAALPDYLAAVVDATLGGGVAPQLAAFRAGFQEVVPLASLEAFYEDEIEVLLCGTGERWTVAQLADAIKFDHGYTSASPPVCALLEVLSELGPADQRRFLRFVTGCPRLPPGGIGALAPRLTVVRKHPAAGGGAAATPASEGGAGGATPGSELGLVALLADGDLPSVMTCANYIKLPPYSSKAVLKERLMFAIYEASGFELS